MLDTARRLVRGRDCRGMVIMGAVLLAAACRGAENGGDTTRRGADSGSVAARDAAGAPAAGATACAGDNGGITLPSGFCAAVFADDIGSARHVTVAPNGDVFVALQGSRRGGGGGVLALRDTNGDGKADVKKTFGNAGGTGIALWRDHLYLDGGSVILRYPLPAGSLEPSGAPDTIVVGMPTGGHAARNFAIDSSGALFVNFGSETNSCQVRDRQKGSPGHDPCTELERRAGIWRFDATKTNQRPTLADRYATGIRNAVGLAVNPVDRQLYSTQHGRDQLYQNWPRYFTEQESAELPAEELLKIEKGGDYGWPYCFYDQRQGKLVLAPEYGGDGKKVGRCAQKTAPIVAFPGHWAPNALVFYDGKMFPQRYHGGAFIAFHGSWNRAPLPQAGYKVVFVPFANGKATGSYETFADGFAGGKLQPGEAEHRPSGLAVAPDGALYVTDDSHGRIWKVVYTGR